MKATLVLMAAGLGRRYGGNKQLDGVGPNGEILMEYAIHDALAAGFSKLVFIIKDDMAGWMDAFCHTRLSRQAEIAYAFQSMDGAPHGRTKPYGTVHAVLCAKDAVKDPFVIINADDYYGPEAFVAAMKGLGQISENENSAFAVPYLLKNTVSPNGTVTRALFEGENGAASSVREIYKIALMPNGTILDTVNGETLDPESLVSMNMWGFRPDIFEKLEWGFQRFMEKTELGKNGEELPVPVLINELLDNGGLRLSLLPTRGSWFGVTYREDRPEVSRKLAELHAQGVYPPRLNGKI